MDGCLGSGEGQGRVLSEGVEDSEELLAAINGKVERWVCFMVVVSSLISTARLSCENIGIALLRIQVHPNEPIRSILWPWWLLDARDGGEGTSHLVHRFDLIQIISKTSTLYQFLHRNRFEFIWITVQFSATIQNMRILILYVCHYLPNNLINPTKYGEPHQNPF